MSAGALAALGELEEALGHRFADRGLLETALTHASLAHETGGDRGGERLEFLGDAVLDLVVAELLFETHPGWDEGELTRARAALVNRGALAARARELNLGHHLRLGRTEQRSAGEEKDTVLADCFEAVVGALYRDGGLPPVARLCRKLFGQGVLAEAPRDPKTELQEWAHAQRMPSPAYATVDDSQAEEDRERFTVEVTLSGEPWGRGVGRSKRLAERAAARAALRRARG